MPKDITISQWKRFHKSALVLLLGISLLISAMNPASAQNKTQQTSNAFIVQLATAQDKSDGSQLSIQFANVTLQEALELLAEEINVGFSYNPDIMPDKKVTFSMSDVSPHEVIYKLLEGTNLEPILPPSKDVIVIREKEPLPAVDAFQQTITGTVVDAQSGEALPGVNVIVAGSQEATGSIIGTTTNVDGEYEVNISDDLNTLVFTYVGYQRLEVEIENRTEINVELSSDVQLLDDIVVVGYGTQQKNHLTGSIGSIKMNEATRSAPVSDFGEAMYGKVAGVQVFNPSGRPGESTGIRIRGVNSLTAGSAPLIVIDGVQMPDFDLNTLNTSDIESIDILKDASSAAIYGSRGSNGVILVTTRSGSAEAPTVSFNYTYTLQSAMDKVAVMNGPEYAQAAIDAAQNGWIDSGGDPNAPNTIEARGQRKYTWPAALEQPETLWDTDFQDVIFSVAPMHKGDLRFSGGTESSTYSVSAGFVDQEGIVQKSDYQRYSMNLKADTGIDDWLSVGGMLNINYDDEIIPHQNTVFNAVQYPSIYPVYGNDGYLGGPNSVDGFGDYYGILFRSYNGHPYHWNSRDIEEQALRSTGYFFTEIGLLENLHFRSSINAYYHRNDHKTYTPRDAGIATSRVASINNSMNRTWNYTLSNLLTYISGWRDHSFDVIAGYEYNKRNFYFLDANARGYDNDLVPFLNAANEITSASNQVSENAMISVLGRINYNYLEKYLASISFRRDGSSRFGPENKWGNFPSVSVGWRIGDEKFMNSLSFLNSLTLRASYGFTGNDNIGDYRWISSMSQGRAAFGNNLNTTYYASSVENADLRWERTRQMNIGFDLGLFDNRIQLEADFYNSKSDGLLLDVPVPETSGFTSVFRNIGSLESTGLELAISTHNITTANFNWTSNLIFAKNQSEITSMGPDDAPVIMRRQFMNIIRASSDPI